MKTPEEYLLENVRPPDGSGDESYTPAEQAFLQKYLGVDAQRTMASAPTVDPQGKDVVLTGQPPTGMETSEDFEDRLKEDQDIQLVSFHLGGREFALPITVIQEVIKILPSTKLPQAPDFLAGVLDLRGRVTPVLILRELLLDNPGDEPDRFIIIARHRGLQVGLMMHQVSTMYRPGQENIEWGVESQVGADARFVLGLLKQDDKIISILSIDRLVESVIRY
ncbi:MAG: chemotaxis protein CheW [Desulfovibrionaceae bacterium]